MIQISSKATASKHLTKPSCIFRTYITILNSFFFVRSAVQDIFDVIYWKRFGAFSTTDQHGFKAGTSGEARDREPLNYWPTVAA